MRNIKKWLALLLTLSLLLNFIPLNILAVEVAELPAEEPQIAQAPEATPEEVSDPPQAEETEPGTPSHSEETPGADETLTSEETQNASAGEGEVRAQLPFSDPFAKFFAEKLIDAGLATEEDFTGNTSIIKENGDTVTLEIGSANANILILLSTFNQEQTADFNYADWTIAFNFTGSLNLRGELTVEKTTIDPDTGAETTESKTYTYQGLGSADFPFRGSFSDKTIAFQTSRTLFNALSASAELNGNSIEWSSTQENPILTEILVADENDHTLNMPLGSSYEAKVYSPYIGRVTGGSGLVTLPSLNYIIKELDNEGSNATGNLGLICNEMDAGTKLEITELTLPETAVDLRGAQNVGGLVGKMNPGAELFISKSIALQVSLQGQNTGGLVGWAEDALIRFASDATVGISAELNAEEAAGGIVGVLTTETGPLRSYDAAPSALEPVPDVPAEPDAALEDDSSPSEDSAPTAAAPEGDAEEDSASLDESVTESPAESGDESSAEPPDDSLVESAEPVSSTRLTGVRNLLSSEPAAQADTPPVVCILSVEANGGENAGVLYGTCTATGEFAPFQGVVFADDAARKVSGAGNCGGVFGTLELTGDGKCVISGKESEKLAISSTLSLAANTTRYGGVVGTLRGAARKNALVAEHCEIASTVDVGTESKNYPKYLGGIVAKQETVTLDASNSTISVFNPKTITANDRGFGGLCAYLDNEALLIADTMKVATDSFTLNPGGGGVVGSAYLGSIVYLKNRLDLSACMLTTNSTSGQIVGYQDCSLIYAPDVVITRYLHTNGAGMELDDIGNYGELYRIPDFLTVGEAYAVTFPHTLGKKDGTENEYVLSQALDYACLALAWQSRGNFPTVGGIDTSNWTSLQSSTITLGGDIDLTGCGIGGLTRDTDKEPTKDKFSGTFNGDGHTLKLDIGAENQDETAKVSKGDGRIFWHSATGLFAVLDSGAKVQDLKLSGRIRISNNQMLSTYGAMKSGALAALVSGTQNGSDNTSMLSAVSSAVEFDVISNGGYSLYLGGLIGLISNTNKTTIVLVEQTTLAAKIRISHSGNGSINHFGGAIGGVAADAAVTITCSGASIGGSIESTGTVNNLYAGGLIGTILPGSKSRSVQIDKLRVDGFALSGSASERMGGILGGIWANADVTIGGEEESATGLTVTNTTLTSNGKAALGGLVYRAAGKWTVRSVNLRGLTISAGNAAALGLMACHGEPYKEETINSQKTEVGGVYLELVTPWDTGYIVPESITFGSGVFDEFVAYTAYRTADGGYQITHNGSGIISLKTANGTVNMTEGSRNTYFNRTAVGQGKQTNPYSRYYYNLDTIMSTLNTEAAQAAAEAAAEAEANGTAPLAAGDNIVNTAERLLIWSVWKYAANNLKYLFLIGGSSWSAEPIGGTSVIDRANFDMKGLSYYPIDITNSSITFQYADVKFYNSEIEAKEAGNKSTRGSDSAHTQHYTMHCALFHDFTVENVASTVEYTMTVNGVKFAGSVGVVDGGSGALLCGRVEGQSFSGNTAVCKVVLAEADEANKAVTLDGLSVSPAGDYAPVLINKIGSHTKLEANYVQNSKDQTEQAEQGKPAGSSLIGDVGGETATNVTVTFAGTIKLNETNKTPGKVFTKATLLNSLRYENGSATYNFSKDKDYTGETYVHYATHGWELGEELGVPVSVEYPGKQGKYLEPDTDYVSKNFAEINDFSGDLPYVALSPATKDGEHTLERNWHELAVNVQSYPLLDGCGTYGHPYQVTANAFRDAASFINNGVAVKGWQVRIPANTAYHTDGTDVLVTYESKDTGFKAGETSYSVEYVRKHLQSAYYQLVADEEDGKSLELSNFNGIGSDPNWAFKGVITGKTESGNLTVTLSGGSSAFIKYSYGSVVRDVTFVLKQTPKLSRTEPERPNSRTEAQQTPGTFFGGVIGCVLGGDNIIENVAVGVSGFGLTLAGEKPYLIPVGGYVGVIAGGGVLFRGTCSDTVSLGTTYQDGSTEHLYNNPIIGRVLGGYAFYEGSGTAPNNGNQNYKINQLDTAAKNALTWNAAAKELTVHSGQGLLLLSAIVSSGAASAASNAYANGVARNASYNAIGKAEGLDDYGIAKSEGSVSYLSSYVTCTGGNIRTICADGTAGITIKFDKDAVFDMGGFGNGYRGLSARYVSNAAFTSSGAAPSAVVLRVKGFDGQNATVQNIDMTVKEYHNDDFHAASLGGIFNIVWTEKQSGGGNASGVFAQNLTLEDCNVSLQYVDEKDAVKVQADTATFADADGLSCVAVGGFIGSVSDVDVTIEKNGKTSNYLFQNIHICGTGAGRCGITGPNSAGGLIGASAMTSSRLQGFPGALLSNQKNAAFGPSFLNCSFSKVDVTAKLAAGGLIGSAYAGKNTYANFSSMGIGLSDGNYCFTSCTVTKVDFLVGQDSNIIAEGRNGVAGGLFGVAGMRVGVNFPTVNTETALSIADEGDMRKVSLSNVTIESSIDSDILYRSDGNVNGPDSGEKNTVAGGVIGRISHVNPTYFYDVSLNGCKADAHTQVANAYAGGIVGYGYTNSTMVIQDCKITQANINGKLSGGFLAYGYSSSSYQFHLSDCSIEESTVNGASNSGGLVGRASSKYYIYNVLLKNTSITGAGNKGRLFGWMDINESSNNFWVYAAGISVFANRDDVVIPSKDANTTDGRSYIGYIAYADYGGTTDAPEKDVDGAAAPYVPVNPNFKLTEDKLLTGDAVKVDSADPQPNLVTSVASRIWKDQKNAVLSQRLNRVSYPKVKTITEQAVPEVSTFHGVQGCGPEDLPVLTIKGGNAGAIEDYLNVITNGGYTEAKKSTDNDNKLSLDVTVYDYQDGAFTEKTREDLERDKQPASVYVDNGTLKVRGSSYDNTRSRFSLVQASFTVKVNGVSRTYTVSVPVVVIRELQYDFMATFYYGAEFHAETFEPLRNHVLESTGNPFTGYLSYAYNREMGAFVDYDWQSYLDDGGSMLAVDKVLSFSSNRSLPEDTQMILVDCQDGNRAYQYKTTGTGGIKTDVKLSEFESVFDGTPFRSSMADVLGVEVAEQADGKFVLTTADDENASVKRNGKYYRLYVEDDGDVQRYGLTVPDLEKNEPLENYYLVITVPDQGDSGFYLNGKLTSDLEWSMPSSRTQVHRYAPDTVDNGENTESTYQISAGYKQRLVSTMPTGKAAINLMEPGTKMQVALEDTVTFSREQAYGEDDPLFIKFMVSLQEHKRDSKDVEERQFPAGTTGKVHFYIQDSSGVYYAPNGSAWQTAAAKTEAASYDWISQGGSMALPLSADGTAALDLALVRQAIINDKSLESKLIITAEMDVVFGSQEVLNVAVPASDQSGVDIWTQLHYVGLLATQAFSLDYTANRTPADDNAKYYRGVQYQAILSLDAARIDQLGVNPLELVADYMTLIDDRSASQIDLTAALNLENLPNYASILEGTANIRFSLSLSQRNVDRYDGSENAQDRIAFAWPDGTTNWSWTISQDQFYDGGVKTSAFFDGVQFTIPLKAYVFVDQTDFANYEVRLRVEFLDADSQPVTVSVDDKDAYVIYTYACIKPTFCDPSDN